MTKTNWSHPAAESGFSEPIARRRQGAHVVPLGKAGRTKHQQNNKHPRRE
jgi:hypothetical protein